MEAQRPLLSVIVPAFNRPAGCAAVIAELDRQHARRGGGAVEAILVDDGSDAPLSAPSTRALPVALLRNARRMGANAARARGLAAARGRFVNFHDSDDGFDEGWLAAVLAAVSTPGPQVDVLVTRRLDEIGGRRVERAQRWFERNASDPARVRRMLAFRNCLGPFGGVVFSRTILDGLRFPDAASSQDWLVYIAVFARPLVARAAPEARFVYRRDGADRISADARAKVLGMFAVVRATRRLAPLSRARRLHQFHRFGAWVLACGRPSLGAIWRRARLARRFWSAVSTVYAVVALGLR